MSDDALVMCPSCEQPALRRIITGGTGVIFRGSGFYVNDSKSSSSRSTGKPLSAGTDAGSGPDTSASTAGGDTVSAPNATSDAKKSEKTEKTEKSEKTTKTDKKSA